MPSSKGQQETKSPALVIERPSAIMIIEPIAPDQMQQTNGESSSSTIVSSGGFVWRHTCPSFHPEDQNTIIEDSVYEDATHENLHNFQPNLQENRSYMGGESHLASPRLTLCDFMKNTIEESFSLSPSHPISLAIPAGVSSHIRATGTMSSVICGPSLQYLSYAAEMTAKTFPEAKIVAMNNHYHWRSFTGSSPRNNSTGEVHVSGPRGEALRARRHLLDALVIRKRVFQIPIPNSHAKTITDDWLAEQMQDSSMAATINVAHNEDDGGKIEISGTWLQVEEARLACQGLMNRLVNGLYTKTNEISLEKFGILMGPGHKFALELFLSHGVLLDTTIPIAIQNDPNEGPILRISMTSKFPEALNRVDAIFTSKITEATKSNVSAKLAIDFRTLDWILSDRFDELYEILSEHASSISIATAEDEREMCIYSINNHLLQETIRKIRQLTYQIHTAFICLESNGALNEEDEVMGQNRFLSSVTQAMGIEMEWWRRNEDESMSACKSLICICLYGIRKDIQVALEYHILPYFEQTCGYTIQILQYRLPNTSEIREFVSGKKDGKLQKIMRETGNITLRIVEENDDPSRKDGVTDEGDIYFELSGQSVPQVMRALEMLEGELPAELTFHLPESHHRRLIGHGGQTIQRIMKRCAVYIKFLNSQEARQANGHPAQDRWVRAAGVSEVPNVVIKTPTKNLAALEEAKQLVMQMAADPSLDPHGPQTSHVGLIRGRLHGLNHAELSKLSRYFASFADRVDLAMGPSYCGTLLNLKIRGYQRNISKFMDGLLRLIEGVEGSTALRFATEEQAKFAMKQENFTSHHHYSPPSPKLAQPELFSLFNSAFGVATINRFNSSQASSTMGSPKFTEIPPPIPRDYILSPASPVSSTNSEDNRPRGTFTNKWDHASPFPELDATAHRNPETTRIFNKVLEYQAAYDRTSFKLPTSILSGDHRRREWNELRISLKSVYLDLIMSDPEFAAQASTGSNVAGGGGGRILGDLWRRIYYRPIEELRVALASSPSDGKAEDGSKANKKNSTAASILSTDTTGVVKMREEVVRLIDEATGMMAGLFQHFRGKVDDQSPIHQQGQQNTAHLSSLVDQMYDCLVFLGDLARYRVMFGIIDEADSLEQQQQHPRNPKYKDYRQAGGHYRMAVHLAPTYGHAYNQLGLLASYTPDLLAALHHYLLAAAATVPFPQARTNVQAICLRILGSHDLLKIYGTREEPVQNLAAALLQTIAALLSHVGANKSRTRQIETGLARVNRALALMGGGGLSQEDRMAILSDPIMQQAIESVILAFEMGGRGDEACTFSVLSLGTLKLGPVQLKLASLLLDVLGKGGVFGMTLTMLDAPLGLVASTSAWMHYSGFFERLKISRPMAAQLYEQFARTTASLFSRLGMKEGGQMTPISALIPELQGVIGIDTFKALRESFPSPSAIPSDSSRETRLSYLAQFAHGLVQADLIAWNGSTYESFSDWESRQKRQTTMAVLARGKLEHEVASLQSTLADRLSHLPWTLPDTNILLSYWPELTRKMGVVSAGRGRGTQARLLITLPVLCELDRAKVGPDSNTARTVIRNFTEWHERGEPFIRLQAATEEAALPVITESLSPEQRGLAAAMSYYHELADNNTSSFQLLTMSKGLQTLSAIHGWRCVDVNWLLEDENEEDQDIL